MKNSTVKNGLRTLFLINPNRIAWVDVAKGIAILLVIIGHTVNFGSATRNFIFSFYCGWLIKTKINEAINYFRDEASGYL